jgi:nicotinamide riboside transporter PnuC
MKKEHKKEEKIVLTFESKTEKHMIIIGAIIVGILVVFIPIHMLGFRAGIYTTQIEAVKNGVAEWKLDENGIASFSWRKHGKE